MLWLLVLSLLLLKVAVVDPWESVVSVPVRRLVEPSLKVSVPVGLATAALPGVFTVTVAVKVTCWPDTEGLTEEASVVVVLALLIVWVRTAEVEGLKLVSSL